jgi:hypothetical protein
MLTIQTRSTRFYLLKQRVPLGFCLCLLLPQRRVLGGQALDEVGCIGH